MSEESKVDNVEGSSSEVKAEVKRVAPIVFLDENQTADIDVDVVSDSESGKILYVLPKGVAKDSGIEVSETENFFVFTPFKFGFSAPNWEQVSLYRQRSSVNPSGRLDKNNFRTCLLVNHLKSWDIRDKNDKVVDLDFESSGELTKESISKINRVPSAIWDAVLTMVEREFGLGSS